FKKHKITAASVRAAVDGFRSELASAASQDALDVPSYAFDAKGRICLVRTNPEGGEDFRVPLCNFAAKIIEEIVFDDGAETARAPGGAPCAFSRGPWPREPRSRPRGSRPPSSLT